MDEANPTPLDAEREQMRKAGYTDGEISQILIQRELGGASQPVGAKPPPPAPKQPIFRVAREPVDPIVFVGTEVLLVVMAALMGVFFLGLWPAVFAWFVLNLVFLAGVRRGG